MHNYQISKILSVSAAVTLLVLSSFGYAKAEDAMKIAVVDVQEVIQKSDVAKNIKTQMDEKIQAYQKDISSQEEKLRTAEKELVKQRAILKPEEMNEKTKAFRQQAASVQRDVNQRKRTLDAAFNKAMGSVLQEIRGIVSDMAKDKSYTVVVSKQQVVFAEQGLDITDEVLKALNSKLSRLKVDFSAPKAANG